MTRAPLWAKSIAVSFPIPVFAPVMITVLPINLFLQVQTPSVQAKYAFKIAMPKTTESPIWATMCKPRNNSNGIFLGDQDCDGVLSGYVFTVDCKNLPTVKLTDVWFRTRIINDGRQVIIESWNAMLFQTDFRYLTFNVSIRERDNHVIYKVSC